MRVNGQSNGNWQSFANHSESTGTQSPWGQQHGPFGEFGQHMFDHGSGSTGSPWGQQGGFNPWGGDEREVEHGGVNDLSDLYSRGHANGGTESTSNTGQGNTAGGTGNTGNTGHTNSSNSTQTTSSTGSTGLSSQLQDAVNQINTWRKAAGLSPLTVDPKLNELAQEHSDDMEARDSMDHNGKGNLADIMADGYHSAAQNVGSAGASVSGILQQMYDEKNNPSGEQGHYKNIMGDYTKIGIAVSSDGRLTIDFAS